MVTDDERNVDPIQEMSRLIQDSSKLSTWGFKESYRSVEHKRLIFDSEWCRIKFVWGGWDYGTGNSMSIYYGRLHAPNESVTMTWDGEDSHAWHRFEHVIHFLDGRSPTEAAKMKMPPPATSKYYDDEFSQKFKRHQPEWLMQMHMEVWEHYGKRLFELFDLRQPNLWEQYQQFLKEFYDIKGRPSFIKPSMDKVC